MQEFIPLPMTRACVQFVTGKDPLTMVELRVPRGERERRLQKALVRWKAPENKELVEQALTDAGRTDLLTRFHRAREARVAPGTIDRTTFAEPGVYYFHDALVTTQPPAVRRFQTPSEVTIDPNVRALGFSPDGGV